MLIKCAATESEGLCKMRKFALVMEARMCVFVRLNALPFSDLPAGTLHQLSGGGGELTQAFDGKHDQRKGIAVLSKRVR